jgi:hypothetical protein
VEENQEEDGDECWEKEAREIAEDTIRETDCKAYQEVDDQEQSETADARNYQTHIEDLGVVQEFDI